MTRDTYRARDGSECQNDADIFAALSRTAGTIPRLPEDAPAEMRKLTVDINDPKRVYAVYRASRRHNFQLLVERYIQQIRYGCLSKVCTTTTCFSCRRRLASGAPVRRYNATSARTLATYMASQDNPQQGLCRNASAPRPTPDSENAKRGLGETQRQTTGRQTEVQESRSSTPLSVPAEGVAANKVHNKPRESLDKTDPGKHVPDLSVLDEPTNTDPRSFVQNVFGTVAFKMLEWLTPRNLDLLTKANEDVIAKSLNAVRADENNTTSNFEAKGTTRGIQKDGMNLPSSPTEDRENRHGDKKSPPSKKHEPSSAPASIPNAQLSHAREPKLSPGSEVHQGSLSKLLSASNDPVESQHLKGIMSKAPKLNDTLSDATHQSRQYSAVQRRLLRKPRGSNSEVTGRDVPLSTLVDVKPKMTNAKLRCEETRVTEDKASKFNVRNIRQCESRTENEDTHPDEFETLVHPQSLSYLSVESIEFLCNIAQSDGSSERHILYPSEISNSLRRRRTKPTALCHATRPAVDRSYSSKHAWKLFMEQSFFDVLSNPDSLIRSFRDEENQLLDTQTMWYLLLRLTRVAPSLVLDSLWRLTSNLFQPPKNLETTNEWVKEVTKKNKLQIAMSNSDAAEIINICLHALVATAPLVTNKQELAGMSRIRSYGLATRGSESASQEHITLCLQYEDAFTHDLAVRLARRLFAAIPIRRRFADLLDLQKCDGDEDTSEPDILETILKSFKFFDLSSEPILDFSEEERTVHEKRMPTLILDWARSVMLQEWQGTAEIPNDGPFGGALATINALYANRKTLLLGDIHFRTEYFAERLDPVEMPTGWLSLEPNKRTVHLLDYPYLFNPSTLVTYFRALNFSRMNRAFETAKASGGLMYSTMAENSLMTDKHRRDQLYRRLDTSTTKFNVLEIGRTDVLKDTFNAIWRREERELLRPLKVRLGQNDGDEGMDSGGVQQEFFRLAIAEAVNPDYGAFTIDTTTQMIWFQPGSPEPLWKFELIGMIVSLAIYNGLTLPVTFPKALYMKLLGEEVSELHHIEDGWPEIGKNLTHLLEWEEKDGLVEDVFVLSYEFSADLFGKPVSCEMRNNDHWPQFSESPPLPDPDVRMVTNENRNNYVSDYIRWMTDISIQPQYNAFQKGFFSCIDSRSVSLFDADTLQSLVEGIQEIDISEMRRATNYVGWNASHRTVRDFWSIVKRYSLDQKRKLLEFTTASDRVPVGGMKNLQFTLQRNGVDDNHLPTSYTCYGILLLPEYSSKEVLKEKLAMALENSKGFGFA